MRFIIMPLVGLATLAVASTGAGAADLPRRAAPPVFVPAPVFTWTGFYAGVNAGYAFDSTDNNGFSVVPGAIPPAAGPRASIANSEGSDGILSFNRPGSRGGFTGGGQIGYNYQFPNGSPNGVVVGVEADAQYIGLGRSGGVFGPADYVFTPTGGLFQNFGVAFVSGQIAGLTSPTIVRTASRMDYFGTVRGRVGYAFDKALFYATGGFAYGDGGNTASGSGNSFSTGYTVGGGVEYAFTSNLTARAEFLYVNLDKGRGTVSGTYDQPSNTLTLATIGGQNSFTAVRGGINYRFNAF